MLYKGKLDQIIMCLYVEVICKIQTMYVTNLRSGLEYIVKEQNDLAKDYYKKIAQPVRVRECETFSVNNVLEGLLW